MITIFGYKKCSTCRNAEKYLSSRSIKYQFVDVTISPPSKDELVVIQRLSGTPLLKFFNTSGILYRELNMKDKLKSMNENEMYDILSSEGRLIKRPILTDGTSATVGFTEDMFAEIWG